MLINLIANAIAYLSNLDTENIHVKEMIANLEYALITRRQLKQSVLKARLEVGNAREADERYESDIAHVNGLLEAIECLL